MGKHRTDTHTQRHTRRRTLVPAGPASGMILLRDLMPSTYIVATGGFKLAANSKH